MRTLHLAIKVADLDASLAFYTGLGYEVAGAVPGTSHGDLTMLALPGDEFVTIELVADAPEPASGSGLNHIVIGVESMDAFDAGDVTDHGGGMFTGWLTDPDGNRIELVQWPPGHAAGMSAADFQSP